MKIDVIIPTTGDRMALLEEAVGSVAQQDRGLLGRVIVVLDRDGAPDFSRIEQLGVPLTVVRTRPGTSARQTGVLESDARWVAFLDDDDLWESRKLAVQSRALQKAGSRAIVSSRVSHVMDLAETPTRTVPARVIAEPLPVADYLFRRRSPTRGRASLYTSTIVADRELCLEVPWRRILRHQDWDWLVRAHAANDVTIIQSEDVLTRIRVGSPNSISRSNDWKASLDWAEEILQLHADAQTTSDFLASQTLRYAIASRSPGGVRAVLAAIRRTGRIPFPGSVLMGLGGLASAAAIKRFMGSR